LPSHDTFGRLFRQPKPLAFGRVFEALPEDLVAGGPGVLRINGKTLRRSSDRAAGRAPLHVVTAFFAGARLAIGQRSVPEGGCGISAARVFSGNPVAGRGSGAARRGLHSQSDTAQTIPDRGGDCPFALKGTLPLLMREVAGTPASPPGKRTQFQTVDADLGRIETRVHRLSHEVGRLFPGRRCKDGPRPPGLAMIACVQSSRRIGESAATTARFHVPRPG
jgi:hypothetical protein